MTDPSDRERVALQAPPLSLKGFPRWRLRPNRRLYRAHTTGHSPWWFSSGPGGRFNLPEPHGTCYLAFDAQTALRERFGHELVRQGIVTAETADRTAVSSLAVPDGRYLADTCARSASDFGMTREIGTLHTYALTCEWALALHVEMHRGIRYQTRFTTAPKANAVALFESAGEHGWPTDPSPAVGRAAVEDAGLTVASRPTRREIRVVEPPVA